ncbi:hypothetical protein E4T52_08041 [Aureobasidium sp. EXF-3400]|nr:hypothetical protein E4T51_03682 [Aureobasidium sp. EXF-12344]KAI4777027.1 hypothetical protein E4T52_08041 [Aureobasidium sp. EXF-3400]
MAITLVDRKVLAHLINYYVSDNKTVVETLRTVLGISVMLEQKLVKARRLRLFDISRETRSLDLYQELLFLAKEGLALTEVHIAPYCGDSADGVYQVMALKLRASFHHIFCLYHNTPPIRLLRLKDKQEPTFVGTYYMASRKDQNFKLSASPLPSVKSFVTNPYAVNGNAPAVMPHVPENVAPQITLQPLTAPARPPGLEMTNSIYYDPPVSASTFLMPPLDYTPETKRLFEQAARSAEKHLHPAHPLVLSLALERATFLIDCLSDYEKSLKVVKKAAKAAWTNKNTRHATWNDAMNMMREMSEILIRAEQVLHPEKHLVSASQVTSPPMYPPPTRDLPAPPGQRNGSARINGSPRQQNASVRSDSAHAGADRSDTFSSPLKQAQQSPAGGVTLGPYNEKPQGLGILQSPTTEGSLIIHDSPVTEDDLRTAVTRSATLIGSPTSPMDLDSKILQINAEILKHKKSKRSRSSGSTSNVKSEGSRMEGTGTEKERKRRAIERAEDELMRSRATSKASSRVRKA